MIRYNLIIGLIIIAVIGFIYYTTAQKDVTVKESKIVLEASDLIVLGAGFTPFPFKFITIASGMFSLNILLFITVAFFARGLRFFLIAGLLYIFGDFSDADIQADEYIIAEVYSVLDPDMKLRWKEY